jgi:hypothetical protein
VGISLQARVGLSAGWGYGRLTARSTFQGEGVTAAEARISETGTRLERDHA